MTLQTNAFTAPTNGMRLLLNGFVRDHRITTIVAPRFAPRFQLCLNGKLCPTWSIDGILDIATVRAEMDSYTQAMCHAAIGNESRYMTIVQLGTTINLNRFDIVALVFESYTACTQYDIVLY